MQIELFKYRALFILVPLTHWSGTCGFAGASQLVALAPDSEASAQGISLSALQPCFQSLSCRGKNRPARFDAANGFRPTSSQWTMLARSSDRANDAFRASTGSFGFFELA